MKHARNAPCPCGSGKKYKKCCEPPKATKPTIQRKVSPVLTKEERFYQSLRQYLWEGIDVEEFAVVQEELLEYCAAARRLGEAGDLDAIAIAVYGEQGICAGLFVGDSLLFGDEAKSWLIRYHNSNRTHAEKCLRWMARELKEESFRKGRHSYIPLRDTADNRWRSFRTGGMGDLGFVGNLDDPLDAMPNEFFGYSASIVEARQGTQAELLCMAGEVTPKHIQELEEKHGKEFPLGSWFVSSGEGCENIFVHGPFDSMDDAFEFGSKELGVTSWRA